MKNLWIFNEKRIGILKKLLRGCDATQCRDIKGCLKVKKTLLSYHLGVLRDKGIVEERKEGREKYYRIAPSRVPFVKKVIKIVET